MNVTVTTAQCPTCKDILYSRANHDFKYCSCGEIFVDGGFQHTRIGAKDLSAVIMGTMVLEVTAKELYADWNYRKNKYGVIKTEE